MSHAPLLVVRRQFDGKGHGFMNPSNKQGYDATAATDAWARIDAFFARTLKGK